MNLSDVIKKRRSIRSYKQDRVDETLIKSIFTEAQQAPSNCNTQPWHVAVVSGKVRDAVAEQMMADARVGTESEGPFGRGDKNMVNEYRTRQIDCAKALYDSVGVKYEEKDKRYELMLLNWDFFGAPHGAFFSMRKDMKEANAVDLGIYLQTVMLLMTANGIACCAQGALMSFTDAAYQIAGVPEDHGVLFGLSFGYAEEDAPINNYEVGRADISNCVSFKG